MLKSILLCWYFQSVQWNKLLSCSCKISVLFIAHNKKYLNGMVPKCSRTHLTGNAHDLQATVTTPCLVWLNKSVYTYMKGRWSQSYAQNYRQKKRVSTPFLTWSQTLKKKKYIWKGIKTGWNLGVPPSKTLIPYLYQKAMSIHVLQISPSATTMHFYTVCHNVLFSDSSPQEYNVLCSFQQWYHFCYVLAIHDTINYWDIFNQSKSRHNLDL